MRVLPQQVNGASHFPNENGVVRVSEEQRSRTDDDGDFGASFPLSANGSILESPVDISPDDTRVEGNLQASTAPIPENADVASVLSADETTSSAAPRKTQSVEHISWMERRIGTLEEELRSLRTENL